MLSEMPWMLAFRPRKLPHKFRVLSAEKYATEILAPKYMRRTTPMGMCVCGMWAKRGRTRLSSNDTHTHTHTQ